MVPPKTFLRYQIPSKDPTTGQCKQSPRPSEKSSQDEIEERQRKQSPEKGLCKDMSEEGQCKEMPKTGQRKTTGDRPMYKRPNDRSMQGSTGMLRPRFNQSGIMHILRYGAAHKAQDGIEESQRKNLQRKANARRWQRKINAKQLATDQYHKNPGQANAKQPLPKPTKKGLHKRETPSVNLPRPACSRRSHATWKSGRTCLPARPNRNG